MRIVYIAWLTFEEARRKRLILVGLALGLLFLVVYGIGFYSLDSDLRRQIGSPLGALQQMHNGLVVMGLYAVNFLVIMVSVLASVDTVSGEIASHSIQSVVTKPLRRWEVLLGKWLGFAGMIAATVLLLAGGVVVISYAVSGYIPTNLGAGLALMLMDGLIVLSLTLLGGTLLSTLANGVVVFMLFALAFMGGWTEQVGAALSNQPAINVGIISSLILPTEALWRRAAYLMQPATLSGLLTSPFVTISVPSPAMVIYGALYGLAALGAAIYVFQKRDL